MIWACFFGGYIYIYCEEMVDTGDFVAFVQKGNSLCRTASSFNLCSILNIVGQGCAQNKLNRKSG